MAVKITTKNNFFPKAKAQLDEQLAQVITKGCLAIEADAKRQCPVDTGNLRRSITTKVKGTSGEVGTNVEYAPYVEYGTRHQVAQPFLIPALQSNISSIKQNIEKTIGGLK